MSSNEPEPGYYQAFLSPQQRGELLADLAEEMSALQSSFGLPSFPSFDLAKPRGSLAVISRAYPRTPAGARAAIRRIKRRPRFRIERLAIKTRKALRRTVLLTAHARRVSASCCMPARRRLRARRATCELCGCDHTKILFRRPAR